MPNHSSDYRMPSVLSRAPYTSRISRCRRAAFSILLPYLAINIEDWRQLSRLARHFSYYLASHSSMHQRSPRLGWVELSLL